MSSGSDYARAVGAMRRWWDRKERYHIVGLQLWFGDWEEGQMPSDLMYGEPWEALNHECQRIVAGWFLDHIERNRA